MEDRARKAITIDGLTEARKHLMKSANLYNLCIAAFEAVIAPKLDSIGATMTEGGGYTPEQRQAAISTLYIEASRKGLVEKMPAVPIE